MKTKRNGVTGIAVRNLFTVMVALLLVFGFNACSSGGGGGGPAGEPGGALSGDITISKDGSELTATYTGNEDVEYEWYKDGELIEGATGSTYTPTEKGNYTVTVSVPGKSKTSRPVIFNPAYVNPDTGKDFEVGKTGASGGIIFYDSFEALGEGKYITMTDNGEQVRYFEFGAQKTVGLTWASTAFTNTSIDGTGTAIGTGRKNTDLILTTDPNAPAAKLCVDYRGGGVDGWFLPSRDELVLLLYYIPIDSDYRNPSWSSSQSDEGANTAVIILWQGYDPVMEINRASKSQAGAIYTRPIRAF